MPGAIVGGVREMLADMRDDAPPLAPDDPALAPIEGVDLAALAAIDAALILRRVPPDDAARDAEAQERGLAPGVCARAAAGWRERRSADPRVERAYNEALRDAVKRR